jgi:hypothetical protein
VKPTNLKLNPDLMNARFYGHQNFPWQRQLMAISLNQPTIRVSDITWPAIEQMF